MKEKAWNEERQWKAKEERKMMKAWRKMASQWSSAKSESGWRAVCSGLEAVKWSGRQYHQEEASDESGRRRRNGVTAKWRSRKAKSGERHEAWHGQQYGAWRKSEKHQARAKKMKAASWKIKKMTKENKQKERKAANEWRQYQQWKSMEEQ